MIAWLVDWFWRLISDPPHPDDWYLTERKRSEPK